MLPRNAILLLRISDDKYDDARGVALQEKNGRAHADKIGWKIGRVIVENDTSAFKRKRIRLPNGRVELRTVRPGFRAALDHLADRTNDGLLAIDLDRVARDPRDLEDLIDVVETAHPRIPVDSVSGSLRLGTDADITMARVMVAVANKASRDTRRRISLRQQELAAQGKPKGGGFRAYGFTPGGDQVVEEEAEVARWMAACILSDDPDDHWTLGRIAADLTARGIPTATGLSTWSARSVSTILTGPRITGLRRYQGRIVGEATWPPILDRATWEAVCAELSRRDTGNRSNVLKRWLNGVLVCGREECGARLVGCHGNGKNETARLRYWCMPSRGGCGRIAISALPTEHEIERQVLEYISDPRVINVLREAQQDVNAGQVRQEMADDEAQLKELAGMWARKHITLGEFREARMVIEERLERNRGALMSSAPRAVRRMVAGVDPSAEWAGFGPAERRDLVLAVVDGYRVLPFRRGAARRFDPARLVPIPKQGA